MVKCVCDICGRTIIGEPRHIDVDLYNEYDEVTKKNNTHIKIEYDLCFEHYVGLGTLLATNRGTAKTTVNPNG